VPDVRRADVVVNCCESESFFGVNGLAADAGTAEEALGLGLGAPGEWEPLADSTFAASYGLAESVADSASRILEHWRREPTALCCQR
jgi:hypothetical protein